MAELYFKVNADYEQLLKMQQEVKRLKQESSDFSGTKAEFEALNSQIEKLQKTVSDTTQKAAKDFQNVLNLKDVNFGDLGKGIEGFDKDILSFTSNLQQYFKASNSECANTLQTVQELSQRLSKIEVTPDNASQIERVKAQLTDITTDLTNQQASLAQNQQAWQDVETAVRNGTTAQMAYNEASKQSTVVEADNVRKVQELGEQALMGIANLQGMADALQRMGVVDSGFTANLKQMEESVYALGNTDKVTPMLDLLEKVRQTMDMVAKAMEESSKTAEQKARDAKAASDEETRQEIDNLRQLKAAQEANLQQIKAAAEEKRTTAKDEIADLQAHIKALQNNGGTTPYGTSADGAIEAAKKRMQELRAEIKETSREEKKATADAEQAIKTYVEQIEKLKTELSITGQAQLKIDDQEAAARQKSESEAAAQAAKAQVEADMAAAARRKDEAESAAAVKRIQELNEIIPKEQERLELLQRQKEAAQANAQAKQYPVSNAISGALNKLDPDGLLGTNSFWGERAQASAQASAAAEQLNAQYEAQKQSVAALKTEQDNLTSSLSQTGQAMLADSEKAKAAKEEREALALKIREVRDEANKAIAENGYSNDTSAVAKRKEIDSLKQSLSEANKELERLVERFKELQEKRAGTTTAKKNAADKLISGEGDDAKAIADYKEAAAKHKEVNSELAKVSQEYAAVNKDVQTYNQQLQEATGHHVRMRTQIMNAREELIQLLGEGKGMTPEFMAAAQQAGQLRRQMNLANAAMNYFANPTRHLAALKTGLQGVAGAAGLVTGVMGLFNTKNEEMAKIQAKVQSIMAVIVGLETTYNAVKKTSTLMMAVQEVKTWALTAARKSEAVATAEATVAQEGLNTAMAANPIGALITVVVVAATAIYALVEGLKALWEANTESGKAAKFAREELEHQKQVNEDLRKSVGQTVGEQMSKYKQLRAEWAALRTEMEKKQFIKDHKKDFNDLGLEMDNVADATRFFATDGTVMFQKACVARAKAMAYTAAASAEYQRAITAKMEQTQYEDVLKIQNDAKKFLAEAKKLGVELSSYQKVLLSAYTDKDQAIFVGLELQANAEDAARTYKAALAAGDKLTEEGVKEQKEYNDIIKGAGFKRHYQGAQKDKKTKTKKEKSNHTQSDLDDEAYEQQEKERKRTVEDIKKRLQQEISIETDANRKRAKQRELDLLQTRESYRDQLKQIIDGEKAVYDKQHEKDKVKVSYYKTDQFRKHQLEAQDDYNHQMKALNLEAYKNDIEVADKLQEAQQAMAAQTELKQSLKSLEQFLDQRVRIEKKYLEQEQQIQEAYKKGAIDENTRDTMLGNVKKQRQAELDKEAYTKFKNSPLLSVAMADDRTSYTQYEDIRKQITDMMGKAMSGETSTSDFNAIVSSYVSLTDKMIERNPFEEMRQSAEALLQAQKDLEEVQQELNDTYAKYGTNAKGEEVGTGEGTLAALHSEQDYAAAVKAEAQQAVQEAQANLSAALEAYNQAKEGGADQEQIDAASAKVAEASVAEAEAVEAETKAITSYNTAAQKYADAKNAVANAEGKVQKQGAKVQTQQNRNDKATKKATETTKKWGEAIKQAASMFQSPIATAISGMVDLCSTTIDSIQAIEKSGKASAEGVSKVATAVTNAVAILAIIQAAWQVINTIMNLFKGKEEEEYQKTLDSLQSKINALDYTFNVLKEDMDDAWGTDAIDKYIDAVEVLTDKQQAQNELIKTQASSHIGHHSLHYYQNKESGITSSERAQAKELIKSLGGDVTSAYIQDWLYSLTAEQLKKFMASGIGTTIMGKLGSVKGTGDYSGSDWLSDMQAFADTAQDAEDLADEMAEKLNGISLDGLKDEFKSLVTTFDTSINDINNSFDEFMREGIYSRMRSDWDEQMQDYYDKLNDLNKRRTNGEITDAEYKKELAKLREEYQQSVKKAQDDYQQALTDAGVNVKDVEQSSTSGGFEALSEDTGTELNGRFAAMQAQETLTAENTLKSVGLQTNIMNIADEIRTIQVNAYLELQAISDNTKKIVEPIMTMQADIKTIKDNTDNL